MRHDLLKLIPIYVCLTIICLAVSGQGFANIDPATCVGAWLFDEEGVDIEEDIFGNGNNGTVKGGPKWTSGRFGEALDCDGIDDFVDFGDNDNLDVEPAASLSWRG